MIVIIPDDKVRGVNMRPIWVLSAPDGPHVGPTNLAIRDTIATVPVKQSWKLYFGKSHWWPQNRWYYHKGKARQNRVDISYNIRHVSHLKYQSLIFLLSSNVMELACGLSPSDREKPANIIRLPKNPFLCKHKQITYIVKILLVLVHYAHTLLYNFSKFVAPYGWHECI